MFSCGTLGGIILEGGVYGKGGVKQSIGRAIGSCYPEVYKPADFAIGREHKGGRGRGKGEGPADFAIGREHKIVVF